MNSINKILESNHQDAYVWNELGVLHSIDSKYNDALNSFLKAIDLDKNNPEYIGNAGAALNNLGRFEEAIDYAEKAIALDSRYADSRRILAFALNRVGREEEAIIVAKQALELKPNDSSTLQELIFALVQVGREGEATKILDEYLSNQVSYRPETLENVAFLYYLVKQIDKAIELYKRVLEIRPGVYDTNNNLGYLYLLKGEYDIAERYLKECVDLDSTLERAHYNLGAVYIAKGGEEEGIREYTIAMNINPNTKSEHVKDLEKIKEENPKWAWINKANKVIMKIANRSLNY